LLLLGLATSVVFFTILWAISIRSQNSTIADVGWGPAILLIGFYVWMYRRAAKQGGGMGGLGGGVFGIGRSKAKRYDAADAANRVT